MKRDVVKRACTEKGKGEGNLSSAARFKLSASEGEEEGRKGPGDKGGTTDLVRGDDMSVLIKQDKPGRGSADIEGSAS